MQPLPRNLSLSALRAFEAAARLRSVKLAAEELGVTAGAVSHQLRQLEEGLGRQLFHRRSNAIGPNEEGEALQRVVGPALAAIGREALRLKRGGEEIVLEVSGTLAMRWLIPRLDAFRSEHPGIRVRLETSFANNLRPEGDVDLAIVYTRGAAPTREAVRFMDDLCGLFAAPALLERLRPTGLCDLPRLPLLSATGDDWDWRLLAQRHGLDAGSLAPAHRFNIDDAAIEAAEAGLGVAIAPVSFVERELRTGVLAPVPGHRPEIFGTFWLLRGSSGPRRAVDAFTEWLVAQADHPPISAPKMTPTTIAPPTPRPR